MSMKMVVLGILMEGSNHPYEMQQLIKRRNIDQYIKIQKGSLYYTVDQLEKSGFIQVEEIIRNKNHPEKTIYAITESGKTEFHDLLLKELTEPKSVFFPINEVIAFMKHLEKDELKSALETHIKKFEQNLAIFEASYVEHDNHIPKYGMYIMSSGIEICRIQLQMFKDILHDLENDTLFQIGSVEGFTIK